MKLCGFSLKCCKSPAQKRREYHHDCRVFAREIYIRATKYINKRKYHKFPIIEGVPWHIANHKYFALEDDNYFVKRFKSQFHPFTYKLYLKGKQISGIMVYAVKVDLRQRRIDQENRRDKEEESESSYSIDSDRYSS